MKSQSSRPSFLLCSSILLLGAVGLAGAAAPQAEEPLSLRQALERAVTGNVDLRRERVTIQIADASFLAAQGAFDFVFSANLDFRRSTTPPLTAEDIAGGFTNTLGFDLGMSRLLETGGSLRFAIQTDTVNTNSRFQCGTVVGGPLRDCTFYRSNLGLTFNHPLLRGFGAEIVQANLRRQRVQKDIALLNRQIRAANVVRDVVSSYWELAYATQELAIRQSAVDLAREQLRITRAQIDVGRLAPIDAAAAEQAISARLQDVAVSEQTRFFRTLDLRFLLGVPQDLNLPAYAAAEAPTAAPGEVDMTAQTQRVLESNPQLRALKMGLRLNEIDIQTARSTVKPRLDFVGQIGATGRKANLFETLAQTAGLDEMTWSAGLTFDMPVENRTARGQLRAAELGAERARLDAGEWELTLRDRVARLTISLRTAARRIDLARQTVGFAQQNLEAEKARFSVGRSTNNEVLRRQQELKAAEIDVVRATVDFLRSETELAAMTTDILDRHGIALKGL